jgi:hypothetical protein
MSNLLRAAQKEGGLDELADAFRRYYAAHLVPPPIPPEAPCNTETADVAAADVADVPVAAEQPPKRARQPDKSAGSPAPTYRDVVRDITPDADNDDYGDLPNEERIALHEDRAAMHRHAPRQDAVEAREPEPMRIEEWWELGAVVHLHQATQCGRVRLSEGGEELHFTDRTPLEPGLVLKVGLELDCRVVERPGRYPTIVELASPLPA